MRYKRLWAAWVLGLGAVGLGWWAATADRGGFHPPEHFPAADRDPAGPPADPDRVATFGSGCFWCTEAVYLRVRGVSAVVSGYSGGHEPNPTYEAVCLGRTGHAEVVRVTFDPAVVSYPELLEVFWRSHDPTTPNRQGHDVGPQYRSVVFTHTDQQRQQAEAYKAKIDAAGVYGKPIVTEIVPAGAFYPAEAYHQNYFALNPRNGYCRAVIRPKLEALEKVFADKGK